MYSPSSFSTHRRFNLIWRSPNQLTTVLKLTSHRLRFPLFPQFTHSRNKWNHVTFLFLRSQSQGNGAYSSTIELFVNGALGHTSRIVRFPAGVRTLYVGASPSRRYGVQGRMFQLLLSSYPFSEDQVASLMTNHADDVRTIALLCEGTYLLHAEPAPRPASTTPQPVPWFIAVAQGAVETSKPARSAVAEQNSMESEGKAGAAGARASKEAESSMEATGSEKEQRAEASAERAGQQGPKAMDAAPSEEALRSHAAPTESPAQAQDTVAEADLHDSEEREAQAQLEEVAQCPIVGSLDFYDLQTPPSELLQRYLDREPFRPKKKVPGLLRGGDDVLLRPPPAEKDEYCALSPPTPLPVLSGDLERFVSLLLEKDGAEIKNGKFQFAVPDALHDEYHYLSEYRAKYVRDAFCFAWAG